MYCKWGGFIDNADRFDPLFFSISPKDAESIDPQERLFLEIAWEVIENAGYTVESIKKSARNEKSQDIGVFVGVTTNSYLFIGRR